MTPAQKEVVELRETGMTFKAIAENLGISQRSVRDRYKRGSGAAEAMEATNSHMTPRRFWAKTHNPDGTSYSVLYEMPKGEDQSFVEQIQEAFQHIPVLPEVVKPKACLLELMTAYPLFDVHYGMKATAEVSGEDYNYEIAARRVIQGVGRCMSLSPNSRRGVIINGGDFTHADDDENRTPAHKHILDVAGRNYTTIDGAIWLISSVIEMALKKHELVEYYSVPGNHDPKNWQTIMFALAERFRENPRVRIEKSPVEFSVITHGETLVAIHHGHKYRDIKDLTLWFAATYPEVWGASKYRTLWTGHRHHLMMKELPGMLVEQHSPITAADHYASSSAFAALPAIKSITFNLKGEVTRSRDPQ